MTAYLVPLYHLLVEKVWEGSERVELSGTLSTGEDAVFVDNTATANGDQWHTVTAQTFIQIHISSLPLRGHRDGSAQRQQTARVITDLHFMEHKVDNRHSGGATIFKSKFIKLAIAQNLATLPWPEQLG